MAAVIIYALGYNVKYTISQIRRWFMSLNVHVARVGIFNVDAFGSRIDKNSPNTTINQLKSTRQEALVIADAAIPSTSGYPTVREYIEAEALLGYELLYMDASFVITGVPVGSSGAPAEVVLSGASNGISDAFGRLRTSNPLTLFDSIFRYGDDTFKWNHTITNNSGSAAVSHLSNQSTIALTVGATSGDSIVRETKRVFAYQAGKSLLVLCTFKLATPKSGLRQRIGFFGVNDGIYFSTEGISKYFTIRKSTSGSVDDTSERIAQADWNVDTLDGSGDANNPSGIELDPSSTQILFTDIEWLGVGTVRVGFVIDGRFIACHHFHHANSSFDKVYMKTAALPLRYEITNTSATSGSSTLNQICSTVMSEGGFEDRGRTQSVSNALTGKNISQTNYTPLVSIRLKSANTDAVALPSFLEVFGLTNAAYKWALIYGTTLTDPSWQDPGSYSAVEYDLSATACAFTNGRIVTEGFFVGSAKGGTAALGGTDLPFTLQIGRTIGGVSDIITLASLATTNNDKAVGALTWSEHV